MYIRGLIPRNSAESAETFLIDYAYLEHYGLFTLLYSPSSDAINTEDPSSEHKVSIMAQYAQSWLKPSSNQTQIPVQVMKFTFSLNMFRFLVNNSNCPWFARMT